VAGAASNPSVEKAVYKKALMAFGDEICKARENPPPADGPPQVKGTDAYGCGPYLRIYPNLANAKVGTGSVCYIAGRHWVLTLVGTGGTDQLDQIQRAIGGRAVPSSTPCD
jgi:hypothetical protein